MNLLNKQPNFDQLPQAVALVQLKLENIERLLLQQADENKSNSDNLLTIQQAALLVSLSVPTLYGLVSKQEIPVSKKRRRLYFDKADLISWAQSGRRRVTL